MPYIFVQDDMFDADTMEVADVVERSAYTQLEGERDALRGERDKAVETIDNLNNELKEANDRYATHVITAAQAVNRVKRDVFENSTSQSFKELFSKRTEG